MLGLQSLFTGIAALQAAQDLPLVLEGRRPWLHNRGWAPRCRPVQESKVVRLAHTARCRIFGLRDLGAGRRGPTRSGYLSDGVLSSGHGSARRTRCAASGVGSQEAGHVTSRDSPTGHHLAACAAWSRVARSMARSARATDSQLILLLMVGVGASAYLNYMTDGRTHGMSPTYSPMGRCPKSQTL